MTNRGAPGGMRIFLILWLGQFVSRLGSSLGSFSLGVWIFEKTGSATSFALTAFTAGLTILILSPVAGSLADRWDRRRLLILSDLGSGLTTLIMAALLWSGRMQPWYVYPVVALMVGCAVFQGPALLASVSLLVPKEQLARASGMTQASQAISQILGPLAAGVLIGKVGYSGVVLVDCCTFLVSLATVALVRFPSPPRREEVARSSPLGDLRQGWDYLRGLPGLFALLWLYAITNLLIGMVQVLLTPLILSFATPVALGTVNSAGAAGILLGGLALSIWGGPRRRVAGVLTVLTVQALVLFLGGLQPSIPLIAAAAFLFMLAAPLASACNQTILQSKVAAGIQGRVFAVAGMVTACSMPIAALAAGPLADRVFKPLLVSGGALADTFVGRLIGTGPGRGVGLMFICLGVLTLLTVGLASLNPRLRGLEAEIPDAIEPEPALAEPEVVEGVV
jgi:DHA3 family macrolide efflux protein-like MFS transporter